MGGRCQRIKFTQTIEFPQQLFELLSKLIDGTEDEEGRARKTLLFFFQNT